MAWRNPLQIATLSLALALEVGATTSPAISVSPQHDRTSSGDRGFNQVVPGHWQAVEPSQQAGGKSGGQLPGQNWNSFEPPQRGVPGRREGGGTRGGDCKFDPNELTALIPQTTMGRTVSANPTFFFYIPAALNKTVEIALTDEANAVPDNATKQDFYKTTFRAVTQRPGVVSVSLPATGTSSNLEVGKRYRWEMSIQCDSDDRSADIVVSGWIERVDMTSGLKSQLAEASVRDRYSIYAKEGLWYEALTALAEQRRSAPTDSGLASKWTELLNSVELGKIAQQPLVSSQFIPTNESGR